ncbi:MAG: M56 family metallopeptidase [Acidobacteria bacterium]|nr:M56 family metallopeptidase [Acidobacteriota bacterium]
MNELMNAWWQAIVLTAIVWIVLRDLPRVSAATRLAIWQVTLAVVLLLPALQLIPMPREAPRGAPIRPQSKIVPLPEPTRPIQQAPVIEVSDVKLFEVFGGLAMLLALLQVLRLAIGYWAVRRLKRNSEPSGISLPKVLTRDAEIRISERVGMPMAIGYLHPVILLPKRLVESLSPEQLNQVLLHESAHLERNDDWVALFERFIRAIFFFQPAVYWIGRQIDREREMATDDWVVAQSGHTMPYAEALARVAEFGSTGRAPILATGVGRRKEIFRRMEALLDSTRSKIPHVSGPLVVGASLLMVFLVIQSAPFSHLLGFSEYGSRSVIQNGRFRREFKHRGEIHYTINEDDIEAMGPGAKLAILSSDGWKSHSVEIEFSPVGKIEHCYFVGGIAQPYGTDAKRFLSRELPQWLKDSDVNLPERLSRWVQAEGVEGAIRKIRTTLNNGIKRRYIEELIAAHNVDASQFRALLRIAEEIGSDDEKRHLFETIRDQALTLGLESALLDLINSIHSDHDREHLLKSLLPEVSAGSLPNLFRSIDGIHADGTKAAILMEAVKEIHQPLPVAFFTSAAGVHSTGDRKQVLLAALDHHGNEASTVQAVARAAEAITSDGDKAEVLTATASNFVDQQAIRQDFFAATKSIHSTGDKSRVLKALLRRRDLSPETILAMSRMAEDMPQGDDQMVILRELRLR